MYQNGRDVKFFKAMVDYFNSTLCIDQKRILSTGFSYGGMMSFALGCAMHDVFRAIAPCSAAFVSGCDSTSKGPIAVWQAHGKSDNMVQISAAKTALRYFLARNGCGTETTPVNPSPCVSSIKDARRDIRSFIASLTAGMVHRVGSRPRCGSSSVNFEKGMANSIP
jgi:polyhydroxybutyrate depolymerase